MNGLYLYILDENNKPVEEPDIHKWSKWRSNNIKAVARDRVGPYLVSTVFLGIDRSPLFLASPSRHPVLWETMIFGGPRSLDYQERYCSLDDAIKGHKTAIGEALKLLAESNTKKGNE